MYETSHSLQIISHIYFLNYNWKNGFQIHYDGIGQKTVLNFIFFIHIK